MIARISWCIALRRRRRYMTKPARPTEPRHASTMTITSHVGVPAHINGCLYARPTKLRHAGMAAKRQLHQCTCIHQQVAMRGSLHSAKKLHVVSYQSRARLSACKSPLVSSRLSYLIQPIRPVPKSIGKQS